MIRDNRPYSIWSSPMKFWQLLGYLGLLPFLFGLYFSVTNSSDAINSHFPFIAYSAIILSFIAGSLWQVKEFHFKQKNLLARQQLISNLISLLAFIALLTPARYSLILLCIGYLFLWRYEKYLAKIYVRTKLSDYLKMRFRLTHIVIALHIAAYLFWFVG